MVSQTLKAAVDALSADERRELLTTQLYVAGDPGNERDFLWRRLSDEGRAALTVPFTPGADGLRASFDIVMAA